MRERDRERRKNILSESSMCPLLCCTQPWWTIDAVTLRWHTFILGNQLEQKNWKNCSADSVLTCSLGFLLKHIALCCCWNKYFRWAAEKPSHLGAFSMGQACKKVWLWYWPSWNNSLLFFLAVVRVRILAQRHPCCTLQQSSDIW